MKAADKAEKEAQKRAEVDERGRSRNAAERARRLAEQKADSMPAVAPLDGPRHVRVVDADLSDPAPSGGVIEVLQQHYLLRLIVGRQLAQQYAASVLGLMWSYIQPAMRFAVYYFIFGVVLKTHEGTPNFALRLFAGMVFVHLFVETWVGATHSIWSNRALVLKMRVPREIFPVAAMVVAAYHTVPQMLILVVSCLIVGWHISLSAVMAGLLGLAIVIAFGMAMALFFSALNVLYKDVQNIVQTITQFLHFMVPMMYSYSLIAKLGETHHVIYQLYMANPLAEGVLLMQKFFWMPTLTARQQRAQEFPADLWSRGLVMLAVSMLLVYLGQKFFSRVESKFPERL